MPGGNRDSVAARAILVAEDDPRLGPQLTRAVAPTPAELVTTVADASSRIRSARHAAWIIDVGLPDGSGIDLLRHARAVDPHVRCVVITGLDRRPFLNALHDLDADALIKPFDRRQLLALLQRSEGPGAIASAHRYADDFGLSARERALLVHCVSGAPRALLAEELGLTRDGLKSAVRRLLDRVGAHSLADVRDTVLRDA